MAREPDPPTQLRTLEQSLDGGPPAKGYVLRGDERWFRERGLRAIAAAADRASFEVTRHDPDDPDFELSRLLDDLAGAPMFAAARCVVVTHAAKLLKKSGKTDSPLTTAAKSFLAGSIGGTLVLDAEGLRADHAVVKAVTKSGGQSLNCRRLYDGPPPWNPDPRQAELVQWFVRYAREKRVPLDADEAVLVCAATGNDLSALDAKLELLRHRPSGSRGRELVGLVGDDAAASPWQVAEDLARGRAAEALHGVETLYRSGAEGRDGTRELDPHALGAILLGSLRGKVRQTLRGARAAARGADVAQAASEAGVPGYPRARQEFEERLRSRPPGHWAQMLAGVLELERATREGRPVDASNLAAFAMRWRRATQTH